MEKHGAKFWYIAGSALVCVLIFTGIALLPDSPSRPGTQPLTQETMSNPTPTEPFIYAFNWDGVLDETGEIGKSGSPYWWLDSGAKFVLLNGLGKTLQGSLPSYDPWRLEYASTNGIDTDNGYHPQNIFRLLTRSFWSNVRVEIRFRILQDNLDDSPNRNESNGVLLMSRYKDHNTLYYAGLRVDGTAVIKKKYQGNYYTMAQTSIFPGTYKRETMPNLIPHNEWIDLRSETVTDTRGVTHIRLLMKKTADTSWTELLETLDDGKAAGSPPVDGKYPVGIRTDFMDVEFNAFRADPL